MNEVYIPIYWLHSDASMLEWLHARLQSDLNEGQIPDDYRENMELQLAWLEQRIPYQKALELITPQS